MFLNFSNGFYRESNGFYRESNGFYRESNGIIENLEPECCHLVSSVSHLKALPAPLPRLLYYLQSSPIHQSLEIK